MQAHLLTIPIRRQRLAALSYLLILLLASAAAGVSAQARGSTDRAELDQILAPIALYPDSLLAHILVAATYPLDVVEADRWCRTHSARNGADAVQAVADMGWDASVQALVAFPEVLARMSENLRWTRRLGEWLIADEQAVAVAIQDLRARADAAGSLRDLEHVRIDREAVDHRIRTSAGQPNRVIIIEAAEPRHIRVPWYNPGAIYGAWRWPAYPPVHWRPRPGYQLDKGFHWSGAVHLGGPVLSTTFDWNRRHIVVLNPRLGGTTLTVGRYPVGYYHSRGYYRDPRRHGFQHWQHRPGSRRDHPRWDHPRREEDRTRHPTVGTGTERYSPTGSYLRPPVRPPATAGPRGMEPERPHHRSRDDAFPRRGPVSKPREQPFQLRRSEHPDIQFRRGDPHRAPEYRDGRGADRHRSGSRAPQRGSGQHPSHRRMPSADSR